MYLSKTPDILKPLASDLIWDIQTEEKEIFLTFDDGPVAPVTLEVLEILKEFEAKATFFCVGENVERNPDVYEALLRSGHAVGNHTYAHEKGWNTSDFSYFRSFIKCRELVDSDLFRPPYGRIGRQQAQVLKHHCSIVMWDVLSGDFDPNKSVQQCYENVVKHSRPGSIIVFHDSLKAREKVLELLPLVLEYFHSEGYTFSSLEDRIP